ncbi:MAG: riboflavin synthase [Limnochordia bacterium]|jgi:riboflavin synthase
MFTGLVEEIGTVVRWQQGADMRKLTIRGKQIMDDLKIDDSVAVNGLCLTVTERTADTFTADVMPESVRMSNLGLLQANDSVNLERAMALGDRLGGHLVTGHIDGTGIVHRIQPEGNAVLIDIHAPPEILSYVVAKGSITVDGVSLTVISCDQRSFRVGVIPHTAKQTIIGQYKPGTKVNLETDLIGKYVERFLKARDPGEITIDFLKENGFA